MSFLGRLQGYPLMKHQKEIILLRSRVPIGLVEANRLLQSLEGNVDKAEEVFVNQQIAEVMEKTGESRELVARIYREQKCHIHKCISRIEDIQYDRGFDVKRLVGVSEKTFETLHHWFYCENEGDLLSASLNDQLEEILGIISFNLNMPELAECIKTINQLMISCFDGTESVKKFSDCHNKLKSDPHYLELETYYEQNQIGLKAEIIALQRNFNNVSSKR